MERCCCNVVGEPQLLAQVDLQLPVRCHVEESCRYMLARLGVLSSFDEEYCLLWRMMVLAGADG